MYTSMGSGQGAGGRISDLQSVMYFVSGQGGGALQGAANSPGLARMAGDRLLMQTADQQGNTAAMAAGVQVVAPEVVSITFVYFDGTNWLPSWDSAALAALPKAVEIILELPPPEGSRRKGLPNATGAITPGADGNRIYRLIVALPAGKPVISVTQ